MQGRPDARDHAGELHIGLFFDGTGCNQHNLGHSRPVAGPAMAPTPLDGADDLAVPFHSARVDSYNNDPTNIARLHALYPDTLALHTPSRAAQQASHWPLSLGLYIEGTGTRTDHADDLRGLAFGTGPNGVLAKATQALGERLHARLQTLAAQHPERTVTRVHVDLFGFSRGAASARHCVNACNDRDDNPLLDSLRRSGMSLAAGFDVQHISVRFVGLFDTVLAVAGDERRQLRLHLPRGCAHQVLQLAARDECRRNFPLSSVAPEHRERLLPGAHSNIGGGFNQPQEGPKLLTRPRRQTLDAGGLAMGQVPSLALLRGSRAYRDAVAQCLQWRKRLGLDANALWVDVWHHWQQVRRAGSPSVLPEPRLSALAGVVLKRPFDGRLQLIALRVMQREAGKAGVGWTQDADSVAELALPDALRPIADRLLQGKDPTVAQERVLRAHYILQSAHWNLDILGGIAPAHPTNTSTPRLPWRPAPAMVYINQPTKGGARVVLGNA